MSKNIKGGIAATNGGGAVATILANFGIRYVFGVPGGQTLTIYDVISQLSPKIDHVLARDEKAAALMAIGYSRVTSRPGVCDGTAGPGAANMLPSVTEAFNSSVAMVALTSNITTKWAGKGASQELDHLALFRPFVKASLRPKNALEIPDIVRRAFAISTTGKPGPVHVDLPEDILQGKTASENTLDLEVNEQYAKYPSYRPKPDSSSILESVDLIFRSSMPVIFAGGGAIISQAHSEVRELAELIGAPIVTTLTGKGIVSEEHPLSLGCAGRQGYRPTSHKALKESDLIIAVGTKFEQISTNNWTLIDETRTNIIHIDIDPTNLRRNYKEKVAIFADARESLRDIIQAIRTQLSGGKQARRSDWLSRVEAYRREWQSLFATCSDVTSSPIRPALVFKEIQKNLPSKSVIVSSGSFTGAFAGSFYNVTEGTGFRFIQARGMAGTEAALPLAIGAALGVDDRSQVLAVTGDGGFGYHIAELETARRMQLSLPIVVLNNNSLGWMKHLQKDKFGSRYISTRYLPDLNYAQIAEAFGCKGIRVEKSSELSSAISDAIASKSVSVVEVMTDPEDCSSTHMEGDMLANAEGASQY